MSAPRTMKPVSKYLGLGRGMLAGCDMVAAVGVGSLIGWWLDGVTGWAPWGLLVFFALGAAAGFRLVYAKLLGTDGKERR